jgi:ketosteroid isomerase-like protein
MNGMPIADAVARLVAFYENLAPQDAARIAEFYAPDAYFRDPFNEVRGAVAIREIFARMFVQLADCRFRILDQVVDAGGAMLVWDFEFRIRKYRSGTLQTIHGASHLRFDEAGRVTWHRDYWDAADELYAKLPLVGALMRWLKRRLG